MIKIFLLEIIKGCSKALQNTLSTEFIFSLKKLLSRSKLSFVRMLSTANRLNLSFSKDL